MMIDRAVKKIKTSEVLQRATFIREGSKMVLKLDLSHLTKYEDITKVSDYFRSVVSKTLRQSIVGLIDLRGVSDTEEIRLTLMSLTRSVAPHFRASAFLVGDTQSAALAKAIATDFGTTNLPSFDEERAAKSWLLTV